MFKTSVKGFNKSDVNNYIIEMHREFAEEKESLEEELSRKRDGLRKAVEDLSARDDMIHDLNSRIDALSAVSAENERLKSDVARLENQGASLTEENEALKAENKRLASENANLSSETEQLIHQVSSLKQQLSSLTIRAEGAEGAIAKLEAELEDADKAEEALRAKLHDERAVGDTKARVKASVTEANNKEKDRDNFLSRFKGLFT